MLRVRVGAVAVFDVDILTLQRRVTIAASGEQAGESVVGPSRHFPGVRLCGLPRAVDTRGVVAPMMAAADGLVRHVDHGQRLLCDGQDGLAALRLHEAILAAARASGALGLGHMSKLALAGRSPVRTRPIPAHQTIGEEERRAVLEVMESGVLSGFLGSWGEEFYGGPRVRRWEQMFAERFDTRYAIAVNSAATGLQVALTPAPMEHGNVVMVSPYTMSAATATIIAQNAIPVFADVESQTYGLDPASVAERITEHTRAIVVVHLFGHPARWHQWPARARAAARPRRSSRTRRRRLGRHSSGRKAGTMGIAGVLSLNRQQDHPLRRGRHRARGRPRGRADRADGAKPRRGRR